MVKHSCLRCPLLVEQACLRETLYFRRPGDYLFWVCFGASRASRWGLHSQSILPRKFMDSFCCIFAVNVEKMKKDVNQVHPSTSALWCAELRGRQKVTIPHKTSALLRWSWGTSVRHSGTVWSGIISSIKVHLPFTLLYSGTSRGRSVLFIYV